MKENMEPILKKYLERVIQDDKTVDSRAGVMQVQRIIQLDLDEIYINLTALLSDERKITRIPGDEITKSSGMLRQGELIYPEERIFSEERERKTEETGLSIDELLQRNNNWVILGDPGSGKTTILKYLAKQNARRYS